MSVRPWRDIQRKKTKKIKVGNVEIGGDAPISVQSMTNTLTTDVKATVEQIKGLEEVGADLVRVSCPDEESSKASKEIIKHVNYTKSDRGQFDVELVLRLIRAGKKIVELPIIHREFRKPKFAIVKKIIWNVIAFYKLKKIMKLLLFP